MIGDQEVVFLREKGYFDYLHKLSDGRKLDDKAQVLWLHNFVTV